MKKVFLFVLTAVLATNMLISCTPKETTKTEDKTKTEDNTKTPDKSADTDKTTTATKVKTGFAVTTSLANSKDATADAAGLAQIDSAAAAVIVDEKGKIVKIVIDSVQTKVNFDNTGKVTTPLDTMFATKNELGEKYGMKKASGIGKEWNEQMAAFAKYVTGKTAAEVKGITVDEKGHATASDLKSSVTIGLPEYIDLVQKAVANATVEGAAAADKLGLGISTNIAKSANAGDTDGKVEAYSTYAIVTTNASGKITSSIIDATQGDVTFDKTGKITTDLKVEVKSKDEIGPGYGMKKASSIGKEWNEEAAAFAKYITGKTATEVTSIAVDEKKHATAEDLKSSVTISINVFQDCVKKASDSAK